MSQPFPVPSTNDGKHQVVTDVLFSMSSTYKDQDVLRLQ